MVNLVPLIALINNKQTILGNKILKLQEEETKCSELIFFINKIYDHESLYNCRKTMLKERDKN